MKAILVGVWVAGSVLLVSIFPAFAHHGTGCCYDFSKRITLKGTITSIEWINPHSFIYLDITNDSGQVENWALESSPPRQLNRAGWTKETLKPGVAVTVTGLLPNRSAAIADRLSYDSEAVSHWKASRLIQAGEITLADGKKGVIGMGGWLSDH